VRVLLHFSFTNITDKADAMHNMYLKLNQMVAQEEGRVVWKFRVHSVPTELYNSSEVSHHVVLEVVCVLMLAINSLLEMIGIVCSCKKPRSFKLIFVSSQICWNQLGDSKFCITCLTYGMSLTGSICP
jgi:hypothetical protein